MGRLSGGGNVAALPASPPFALLCISWFCPCHVWKCFIWQITFFALLQPCCVCGCWYVGCTPAASSGMTLQAEEHALGANAVCARLLPRMQGQHMLLPQMLSQAALDILLRAAFLGHSISRTHAFPVFLKPSQTARLNGTVANLPWLCFNPQSSVVIIMSRCRLINSVLPRGGLSASKVLALRFAPL